MKYRVHVVEIVAVLIALSGCGRAKLVSVERYQLTVEENLLTEKDANGEQQVVVVVHRDDCPADRTRLSVWAGNRETADCMRGLAVGSHIERVHAIYKHKQPMSCGARKADPKSAIGPCSVRGVSFEQIGTPCAKPAAP